jgi:hypothetical protein
VLACRPHPKEASMLTGVFKSNNEKVFGGYESFPVTQFLAMNLTEKINSP